MVPQLASTTEVFSLTRGSIDGDAGSPYYEIEDVAHAVDAALKHLSADPSAKCALLIGPRGVSSQARLRQMMLHCDPGQLVVTLAVQDLVRDSVPYHFHDLGNATVGDRVERLFLVVRESQAPAATRLDVSAQAAPEVFVGRRKELQLLKRKLDESKLLTVYGLPGAGKSALLRRFVLEQESAFHDGTYLVDLASVRHPELLLAEVGRTVGAVRLPGESLLDSLVTTLARSQALLVLDNGHHLHSPIQEFVVQLQGGCPQLAILVGSRRTLGLRSESKFRLDGLENASMAEDWRVVREYDAPALFEERARHYDPDFQITAKNATDVALLCQRLDGNPLAIELAAAKASVLAPAQILGRLEHRFLLLKKPGDLASVEETIEWTFNLLSTPAQQLLCQLSTFRGSFTFDAAELVCDSTSSRTFLAAFEELLDGAFVLPSAKQLTKRHFYLPETIRAFAVQKRPAFPEVGSSHRSWCLELARNAASELYGPDQASWLEEMDAAYEDMRSVISEASLPNGDVRLAIDVLLACAPYLLLRNYYREAIQLSERLSKSHLAKEIPDTSRVLNVASACAYYLGDWRASRKFALQALRQARRTPIAGYAARARCSLGMAAQRQGHTSRAVRHYKKAAEEMRDLDADRYLTVLGNLLGLQSSVGQLDEASKTWAAAESMLQDCRDPAIICSVQLNGAHLAMLLNQDCLCARLCASAFQTSSDLEDALSATLILRTAVRLAVKRGEYELAARLAGASMATNSRANSQPLEVHVREFEQVCKMLSERLGTSAYEDLALEGREVETSSVQALLNGLAD